MAAAYANLDDMGNIICPHCNVRIITPIGNNPHKMGRAEKMILHAQMPGTCPFCKKGFYVDGKVALQHNHYWFPDEPEYQK